MNFSDIVFQLIIGPLKLIYEFIFYYAELFAGSRGIAVIMLGLVINFMLLPLYNQADAIQFEERDQQKRMDHWVSHIKKTFSGNERFMMMQTYYRQNNYKPYYSLRGMMPLILEIPFFIAAYDYLSGLSKLSVPFGPISNLTMPDGLIEINGLHFNLLPLIMTLINIISGAIYTKGLKLRDKLQLYGMAVIFLVLLYNSPSGLVLYWTVNNLFSLVKNIIIKLKKPHFAACIVLSIIGVSAAVWAFAKPNENFTDCLPMLDIAFVFEIPLLIYLLRNKISLSKRRKEKHKPHFALFFSGCIFLTLLTGVLIPSSVISASPIEFVAFNDFHFPIIHVLNSFLLAAGLFIIWLGLFYYLSNNTVRQIADLAVWIISIFSVINYMFFGTDLGTLSSELKFDKSFHPKMMPCIINIAVLLAAMIIFWLIYKKNKHAVQIVYIALGLAVIGMSGMNIAKIKDADQEILTARENTGLFSDKSDSGFGSIINFSKNKKNVIVLMMDRAVSNYIPYIFAEKPELKEKFSGFTYYPNTLSYGPCTNYASPALYGGYEYTPTEINARSDEKLVDKQNEALKVMPSLFYENNYAVTVIEPPYAGYSWVPDLSIYNDYPEMKTYNVEQGQFNTDSYSKQFMPLNKLWRRNFFCYSVMKTAPFIMQPFLYQNGTYYSSPDTQVIDGRFNYNFMNSYAVMDALPEITSSEDTQQNTFLMMSNSMTHSPQALQKPDYIPSANVDNTEYDNEHPVEYEYNGRRMIMENVEQIWHYQINMSAMLRLSEWFDYMRENGVYDNTRIIIAADHGAYNIRQFEDMIDDKEGNEDFASYNPLLLVKDFNSTGFNTDNSFMTNADVPTLTFDKLINDPINPFTNKPVTNDAKQGEQKIITSIDFDVAENNGNKFLPAQWYSVHDNIFDLKNWKRLDVH